MSGSRLQEKVMEEQFRALIDMIKARREEMKQEQEEANNRMGRRCEKMKDWEQSAISEFVAVHSGIGLFKYEVGAKQEHNLNIMNNFRVQFLAVDLFTFGQ
ncbi:hypothetical protein NPIL_563151 [Nephila pilipes]|uniref:Uncharacterized protein n=1 Tax=Nephila pilipes TaxID=299642 RepID=A0A8X6P754_NEPPI|nr:hypothetical protein NPIL_563151 [Nephila pilipes]